MDTCTKTPCLGLVSSAPEQSPGHTRGRESHRHQRIQLHPLLWHQTAPGINQMKFMGRRRLHHGQRGNPRGTTVRWWSGRTTDGREHRDTQPRTSIYGGGWGCNTRGKSLVQENCAVVEEGAAEGLRGEARGQAHSVGGGRGSSTSRVVEGAGLWMEWRGRAHWGGWEGGYPNVRGE